MDRNNNTYFYDGDSVVIANAKERIINVSTRSKVFGGWITGDLIFDTDEKFERALTFFEQKKSPQTFR